MVFWQETLFKIGSLKFHAVEVPDTKAKVRDFEELSLFLSQDSKDGVYATIRDRMSAGAPHVVDMEEALPHVTHANGALLFDISCVSWVP